MNGQLYKRRYSSDPARGLDMIGYLLLVGNLCVAIAGDKIYPNLCQAEVEVKAETFIKDVTIPDELYQQLLILARSRAEYEEKIKEAGTSLINLL